VQLHNRRDRFKEAGFKIVLVGLGTADETENFRRKFSVSFPVICDPKKDLYRQYGLGRGGVASYASPAFLLKGMLTMSRGYLPGIPRGDITQMPGVFLIDTRGIIRYSYFSKDASDYPPVDTLLALTKMFA
jgi:peroxiredoxin